MSQNAYEIRHDILNEARDMLFQIWSRDCDITLYNASCGAECRPVELKDLPEPPTIDDILKLANTMNEFVSDK